MCQANDWQAGSYRRSGGGDARLGLKVDLEAVKDVAAIKAGKVDLNDAANTFAAAPDGCVVVQQTAVSGGGKSRERKAPPSTKE
jgi:hypothetical protein